MILVFGEEDNDRSAIRVLVDGLRPDLRGRVRIEERRSPFTLVKDREGAKLRSRASKVVAVVRAEQVKQPVRAVVFHQDTDEVEPSHVAGAQKIRAACRDCPGTVVAAVAAREVESWWFLFPDAVGAVRSTWQSPRQYVGRDAGLIVDPKKESKRAVRPAGLPARAGAAFRTHQEEGSEDVARRIVEGDWLRRPLGTSQSWSAFVEAVEAV